MIKNNVDIFKLKIKGAETTITADQVYLLTLQLLIYVFISYD